jgi:hypothetical protein
MTRSLTLILGHKRYANDGKFRRFRCQLFHIALARILEPLKKSMTTPEVIKCPDGHYRRAIYNFGPYIGDYPEQVLLCPVFIFVPRVDLSQCSTLFVQPDRLVSVYRTYLGSCRYLNT